MYLALAALPGVITSCLLVYVLKLVTERHGEERQAQRIEVDRLTTLHSEQIRSLLALHAEQVDKLTTDHRREVAVLCQRIQAPQVAVAEHAAVSAPPDPPVVDLENDLALIRDRERMMREFAEDLATEH